MSPNERPQDRLRNTPWARLLGIRWMRRDDRFAVLRFPFWMPRSIIMRAVQKVEADYRVAYPEALPKVTVVGGRRERRPKRNVGYVRLKRPPVPPSARSDEEARDA